MGPIAHKITAGLAAVLVLAGPKPEVSSHQNLPMQRPLVFSLDPFCQGLYAWQKQTRGAGGDGEPSAVANLIAWSQVVVG